MSLYNKVERLLKMVGLRCEAFEEQIWREKLICPL